LCLLSAACWLLFCMRMCKDACAIDKLHEGTTCRHNSRILCENSLANCCKVADVRFFLLFLSRQILDADVRALCRNP
jgi:hypothetical protein